MILTKYEQSGFIIETDRGFRLALDIGVKKPGIITKRLSTKLKTLIRENRDKVHFIEIDSWKMRIKKDI